MPHLHRVWTPPGTRTGRLAGAHFPGAAAPPLGIWGGLGGIGATAAWLIGGPLVDGPGWQWIFFINIPIGLAAFALSPVLLRESRNSLTRRSYDPAHAGLRARQPGTGRRGR